MVVAGACAGWSVRWKSRGQLCVHGHRSVASCSCAKPSGQSVCPLLPTLHSARGNLGDGRVAGRSLVRCCAAAGHGQCPCPMSGLNTLCGWLRRLLSCWTARPRPSRKPRDPGKRGIQPHAASCWKKLIASAGWRPSRCLNTSVMHPRAKWERGGHPLVQECTASHVGTVLSIQEKQRLDSHRVTTYEGTVPRYLRYSL